MDYCEARAFVDRLAGRGCEMGLGPETELLQLLGDPQDELRFVHIAGTNGKGSVLAYLEAVLERAGYRVGRYVSPTLFSYRERFQINGAFISREEFAQVMTEIAAAAAQMKAQGHALPSAFEAETAAAFLYFRRQRCDIVLLETGMGGRLDATNLIRTPVVTALASISMDHMEVLGSTLAEIAWNKAGIFKPGVEVVSAVQQEEAAAVIRLEAEKKGCPCTFVQPSLLTQVRYGLAEQSFSYGAFGEIRIRLAGKHQIDNAALALECIGALLRQGFAVPAEAVREGMAAALWAGRFSVIREKPYVILDGAHNPDAAGRLREALLTYFPTQRKFYIMGVFSDKEYDKIIDKTADLAEHIVTIETPDNPRALPKEALAEAVRRVNPSVETAENLTEAFRRCYALAGEEDVILAFGSLSFLAEAKRAAVKSGKETEDERFTGTSQ